VLRAKTEEEEGASVIADWGWTPLGSGKTTCRRRSKLELAQHGKGGQGKTLFHGLSWYERLGHPRRGKTDGPIHVKGRGKSSSTILSSVICEGDPSEILK